MRKAPSALLANLVVLAVSGLVVFAGLEIFLRMTTPGVPVSPPEQGRGKASRFDPLLGWANKEGAAATLETPEFKAQVAINSKGLRGPEIPYERAAGRPRIALLGDSFAWGFGVSNEEGIAARLGALLPGNPEVLNMGTVGYGTDQELLFFESEGHRYDPDLVLLVFCSNDVPNNLSDRDRAYGKPRFVLEADTLRLTNVPIAEGASWGEWLTEYRPAAPPSGPVPLRRKSRAFRFLVERKEKLLERLEIRRPGLFSDGFEPAYEIGWSVTYRLIERLRRDVESRGGRLAVLIVPRLEQLRYPSWIRPNVTLAAFCEGAHIPCYDFLPDFLREPKGRTMFYPVDGHWNAAGHAFAAGRLADYLQRSGLMRAAASRAAAGAPADSAAR